MRVALFLGWAMGLENKFWLVGAKGSVWSELCRI